MAVHNLLRPFLLPLHESMLADVDSGVKGKASVGLGWQFRSLAGIHGFGACVGRAATDKPLGCGGLESKH